ncbi:hypothetical protein [Aureivirga sp. CE67]|uniref:hypothetical protein n=1 Tax=Aureivirga sp. CE67 TaxID=1788983 RepID=UPI0018CAC77A|nr:hypothetical protein [Aureivirga sp. CE67]
MKKETLIKLPYWIGIVLDAIIGFIILIPSLYSSTIGQGVVLDLQGKLNTSVGGLFIFSWTFLLIWALKNPYERRIIGLLTAVPVLLGLVIINLISFINGNPLGIIFVVKLSITMILFIVSYYLAGKKLEAVNQF